MKKMTKFIALALSMVLFALALTACGPNLLSGGDGGSKDTEGGIGDTLSNMFFDYTVLEATSPAEYEVKSRLLCKMLYNVFTISTYQN